MSDLENFSPAATAEQRRLEYLNQRARDKARLDRPARMAYKMILILSVFCLCMLTVLYLFIVMKPQPLYGQLDVVLRSIGI